MFILEKDKNSFFFRHYFVIFDLSWRWIVFGLRRFSEVKSLVCTYTLCLFDKVQICLFRLFFVIFYLRWPFMTWRLTFIPDLWPQMTSDDLTLTSRKQTSRPSFWYIIYHLLPKFKICPFSEFLTSGDLCWPRDPFFWKAYVKSAILIYTLPTSNVVWNLTPNLTFGPKPTGG